MDFSYSLLKLGVYLSYQLQTNKIMTRTTQFPATITTCFGTTKVWNEKNHKGETNTWIEYPNEYGFTTTERVTRMQLDQYIKEA